MFPVVDVSSWERLSIEQMGTKPKFWCQDESGTEFLFKESRSHAGEHWSEKVAAEIAKDLGLPHAEIELAVCDGKNGTISKNFLDPDESRSLVHGNELLSDHDADYPANAPNFRLAQHTLDRIFRVLEEENTELPAGFQAPAGVTVAGELFVGYLLLDALIGNTDRHHANWGVILSSREDGSRRVELAPTFDHASSLGRELSDHQRQQKLNAQQGRAREDQTVVGYLKRDRGRSRIYLNEDDEKALHPMQVFQHASMRFATGANAWIKRVESFTMTDFEQLIDQIPPDQMSQPARGFSLCLFELSRTALINRNDFYD